MNFSSRGAGENRGGGGREGYSSPPQQISCSDLFKAHSHYCPGDKDPHPGHTCRQFSFALWKLQRAAAAASGRRISLISAADWRGLEQRKGGGGVFCKEWKEWKVVYVADGSAEMMVVMMRRRRCEKCLWIFLSFSSRLFRDV